MVPPSLEEVILMLILQNLSYTHPNRDLLFHDLNLTVNPQDKIALIGNNGVGKSTLLKILAGELSPSDGQLKVDVVPYYIPQIFGQFNHLTVAQALRVEEKLTAFHAILAGDASEENYARLNDDWTIESRCEEALSYWQLEDLDLNQQLDALSGGQKTRVLLAGISIHQPELVLMDEPSNHLDLAGRKLLYDFVQATTSTLLIVSHDRKLLSHLHLTCEMTPNGIAVYGGNYEFYSTQKQTELDALNQDLQNRETQLRKAKQKQRESMARQQKLDARGKKKGIKSGMPKVMMNKLKNDAENSSSKMKGIHRSKVDGISDELRDLRAALPEIDKMKFGFEDSSLHQGKVLFKATETNFSYGEKVLWARNLDIQVNSGERIALKGPNGSGKTTFIRLLLGDLEPKTGKVERAAQHSVYIDQDYSLIDNSLTVYEQAQQFNTSALLEHDIKIRLNRFLFSKEDWDKPCEALSGGERMRLMLCCLTISQQSPDVIVLDEPTNNLDIQNIEILTRAINEYRGTLLVISHDENFLEQIGIERTIEMRKGSE